MVKILIVRHGHSVANEKQIFAGATDVPLSEIGKKQAELVSNYILNNYSVDAIYSSELSLAKNTVIKVSETINLPINTNNSFNEVFGGKWESITFEEIYNKYPNDLLTWLNDIGNSRCTDGESFSELRKRAFEGLKEIAKQNEGKTLVLATHAGVSRALICAILNLSNDESNRIGWVSNASITTVIYNNGSFSLEQIGFDEYLNELKTSLPKNI